LNQTFPNNQYAKCTIDTTSASYMVGPAVRCSSGNGYFLGSGFSNSLYLTKIVSGTPTVIDSVTTTLSVGDVIELRVTGTTLRCLLNGSPVTNLGDVNGDFTDSDISSGSPGFGGFYGASAHNIDNFECTAAS
jgi:hypothetical protein